jgi:SAM-dependent methyltransferase
VRSNEDALFAKRASSFGAHASSYAEHRPDYPSEAIRWALEGTHRQVVLDLAAGTGKLTGGLISLGFSVVAVEPDPGMLGELTRLFPEVTALVGTAERIPLPDGSVDAVLAGQAFHWFDVEPALTEIARVLRPGGVVGALWNHEDEGVGWVAGLAELTKTSVSRGWLNTDELPAHPAFTGFERAHFPHSQRRTAQTLIATIGTYSHALVISEEERTELLDRVRAYLAAHPETAHGEFDVPLTTTVVRAQLAGVALEDQA